MYYILDIINCFKKIVDVFYFWGDEEKKKGSRFGIMRFEYKSTQSWTYTIYNIKKIGRKKFQRKLSLRRCRDLSLHFSI